MIGEASGIVPDRGMNILYRVTLNTLGKLTDDGLTQNNYSSPQQVANTRLSSSTPKGILAGSVVAVGTVSGTIVAATGGNGTPPVDNSNVTPVGVAENNAIGYPYESSSGVGSGKCPYLSGSGSVFATDLYETALPTGLAYSTGFVPGCLVYSSANGLLCPAEDKARGGTIVGVVLTAPTTTDPFMVVQMRI